MRVRGYDISLNHGAWVELRCSDARLMGFGYYTDKKGIADASKKRGTRIPVEVFKPKDKQQRQLLRLEFVQQWFLDTAPDQQRCLHVAVEDYAMSQGTQAYHIGEVGGALRMQLMLAGHKFRLHDPGSVKMYATHNGNADKQAMIDVVERRWGVNFDKMAPGKDESTVEDLADAYAIARLLLVEVKIRAGEMMLTDLEHDKERQVFNRVTKSYPVSLLGRDWLEGAA